MRTFFQEVMEAISDFKFYKRVKDFQTSRGMKYIFLLIFLITLILTIRYSFDISKGLGIAADWTKGNLPIIEIQNGIVSVDAKQPYKIVEEDFALILDTTGEITSLDEYKSGILLTKNKILYKQNEVKTESYDLSNIESVRIDENFMKALRKNLVWIIFPFMLLGIFIYFCIARFLQIFIFSLISLATSSIAGIKLSYRQLFNIGIYAITPSVLLGALVGMLGRPLPFFGIIYYGVYIIYLIMAVTNCKEEQAMTESQF